MPDLSHTAIADTAAFEARLNQVPQAPGVYQWKDARGTLLYVGKSKKLRDRMRSYFGAPGGLSAKTRRMVAQIADFEIIVTRNELEALLLEMNLIKQHRPKYNMLLKDDKSYPYIKVTLHEAWPRVLPTRTVAQDGARYFGPYASAGAVYTTLELLNRLFRFRPYHECKDSRFVRHRRLGKPCLYYDMKRCLAPCVPGLVAHDDYRAAIDAVCRFLSGKSDEIVRDLRQRMEQAADALNFERAAYLRDQIQAIERVLEKQQVLRTVATDQDVIAFAREDDSAVVQVLFIRGGKLIDSQPYPVQGAEDEPDSALLASFLTQFYDRAPDVPPALLLAEHIEEPMIIEQWLSEKRGQRVEIAIPRRGEKRRLVELAAANAARKLSELGDLNRTQRTTAALVALRDMLGLAALPQRIECYDISNTQGTNSVGSMVVFEQGAPAPRHYRRFRIKTVEGANDAASIAEVLRRRFARSTVTAASEPAAASTGGAQQHTLAEVQAAGWALLPDLLLVDGGAAQRNAALRVLADAGLEHIPVVGVVKGPQRTRFDLLVDDDDGERLIELERGSGVLHLVQQVDEEAHRFAIAYHRKLRSKAALASPLDDVPGIGPKRRRALLHAFGSLDGIRQASEDDLAAVPGMTRAAARALKERLPS